MAFNDYLAASGTPKTPVYTDAATTTGATLRISPEIRNEIQMVEPDSTMFLTTTETVLKKTRQVKNHEYTIQEEWPINNTSTVATAVADTTTDAVTVTDVTNVTPGMVGVNTRTGEQMRVVDVNTSTKVLTLVNRGDIGTTAAANINAGDTILWLSAVLAEGYTKAPTLMRAPNMHSNYAGRVAHAARITTDMIRTGVYGVPELDRLDRQAALEFRKRQERFALFSEPAKLTSSSTYDSGYPLYTTGGLRWYSRIYNRFNMGGALTLDGLQHVLTQCARYGGDGDKVIMTGGNVFSMLIQMPWVLGLPQMQQTSGSFSLGFDNIREIPFPGGRATVIRNRNLDEAGFQNEAIVYDPRYVGICEFEPVKIERNIQELGSGFSQWQFLRVFGVECTCPQALGHISNINYVAP